ncbi:MAG TPA: hypothetical protein VG737_12080 [Cyclobacteriaceae bacterium]|nr:hypothetical protein [Cyclobacteriaceae bacterium]
MVLRTMLILSLVGIALKSSGQQQLVLIRKGEVVARYFKGDDFRCKLINGKQLDVRIHDLAEFYMVASNDTIMLNSIAAVDSRGYWRTNVMRDVGYIFMYGGIGYVVVDQVNEALGDGATFDQNDWHAVFIAGVGVAMLNIKPKYRRVKNGMVLRVVGPRSPYYSERRVKY